MVIVVELLLCLFFISRVSYFAKFCQPMMHFDSGGMEGGGRVNFVCCLNGFPPLAIFFSFVGYYYSKERKEGGPVCKATSFFFMGTVKVTSSLRPAA